MHTRTYQYVHICGAFLLAERIPENGEACDVAFLNRNDVFRYRPA